MSKFIIKAKDGSGWFQGLTPSRNNKKKMIMLIATNKDEAEVFHKRRDAKNTLRLNRFATSNYEIEMLDDGKSMGYMEHKEYGDE